MIALWEIIQLYPNMIKFSDLAGVELLPYSLKYVKINNVN